MSPHETPSVSIDGHAIRRIREAKRLTQLYVAKVVGVTTDTVSRWENNRYPTIRRDNALNLAEALEVELGEILKREEEPMEVVQEEEPRKPWPILSLLALMLIGGAWFLLQGNVEPKAIIHAERLQPLYAAPGSRILVRVQILMDKPLKGVIIKEQFPKGWKIVDAVPSASSVGAQAESARWMLRNPAQQATLTYLLEVDSSAQSGSQAQIAGEVIANPDGQRSSMLVTSAEQMQVAPLHWVDADGNQVIDDMEIIEISDLFDKTAALRSEWDQIESIWDAGGYRWDDSARQFVPTRGE